LTFVNSIYCLQTEFEKMSKRADHLFTEEERERKERQEERKRQKEERLRNAQRQVVDVGAFFYFQMLKR